MALKKILGLRCLMKRAPSVRSAMPAASQLPGRGPTVVDMAPIPAR